MGGIGAEDYRMRIGRFAFALKYKRALTLFDVYCVYVIFFSGNMSKSISLVVFIYFIMTCKLNIDSYKCNTSNIRSNSPQVISYSEFILALLLVIIQMFLIMSGLHPNPGPVQNLDFDHDTSDNSSEHSTIFGLLSNSISFLHLNVQSLLPKLDLLAAEYHEFWYTVIYRIVVK